MELLSPTFPADRPSEPFVPIPEFVLSSLFWFVWGYLVTYLNLIKIRAMAVRTVGRRIRFWPGLLLFLSDFVLTLAIFVISIMAALMLSGWIVFPAIQYLGWTTWQGSEMHLAFASSIAVAATSGTNLASALFLTTASASILLFVYVASSWLIQSLAIWPRAARFVLRTANLEKRPLSSLAAVAAVVAAVLLLLIKAIDAAMNLIEKIPLPEA
jgi:hypothetical protein